VRSRGRGAAGIAIGAWCAAVALHASHPAGTLSSTPSLVLPQRLADTGLYAGSSEAVDPNNRSFAPQYPLWSDGLQKSRWMYLPPGTAIDASDPYAWRFPSGTRFWKEFRAEGRKVETRMLWKASEADGWIYASYLWNEAGTEALLADERGVPAVVEVSPGRRHGVPSRSDCVACHGHPTSGGPLGFNALQLSTDRDPDAVHGETLEPGMLTLAHLVGERLLAPVRRDLVERPPRITTARPATRAVLGYLAANCGVCHNGRGEIAALGPTIPYRDLLEDGEKVAQRLVGQATRWQLAGAPEGSTVLVDPGAPDHSALLARMRSRSPSTQMPPLGTVLRDQRAVDVITRWISDLRRAPTVPGPLLIQP
jgi:hypothetical protein